MGWGKREPCYISAEDVVVGDKLPWFKSERDSSPVCGEVREKVELDGKYHITIFDPEQRRTRKLVYSPKERLLVREN